MNQEEILKTVEDEMMSVIQNVDELLDERVQSGEIDSEQYLKLAQEIQTYADGSRKVIALLRTQLTHGASSFHNLVCP